MRGAAPEFSVWGGVPNLGKAIAVQTTHNERAVAAGENGSVHLDISGVPPRVARNVKPCVSAIFQTYQVIINIMTDACRFELSLRPQ